MKAILLVCLLSGLACAQVPQSKHVWIITEENHSYESIIGNSSMPYYNSLAKKYGTSHPILFADAQLTSRALLARGRPDRDCG